MINSLWNWSMVIRYRAIKQECTISLNYELKQQLGTYNTSSTSFSHNYWLCIMLKVPISNDYIYFKSAFCLKVLYFTCLNIFSKQIFWLRCLWVETFIWWKNENCKYISWKHNVWFTKKDTKRSSVLLLCLVSFFTNQTLFPVAENENM